MGSIAANPPSPLRRRNSISTFVPSQLHLPSRNQSSSFPITDRPFPTVDFELVSLHPSSSYTSLKDLLPSSPTIHSPTGVATQTSCHEISIRNRLVKQAAWAYLQPMATSPESAGDDFFHRIWVRFSSDYVRNPVTGFLGFFKEHVIPTVRRAFYRLLGVLSLGWSR